MQRSAPLIALLLALSIPSPSRATGYDFVVIANSQASGPFANVAFQILPSIGNDGGIAFVATPVSSNQAAIFIGSHAGLKLSDYARITPAGNTSVNELGTSIGGAVAFANGSGVLRASAGVVTPIFQTTQSIHPDVNTSGVLAYVDNTGALAVADSEGSTILIQNGDQVGGGTISHVFSFADPDINDAGQVAFYPLAFFPNTSCDEPIMRTFPGGADVISLGGGDACEFFDASSASLAINELGQVAYAATLDDAIEGLVDAVFVDSSKIWDARDPAFLDPGSDTLLHVTNVALNDVGEVAFRVEGNDADGVYTGSDPVSDKVLAIGDPLCDSTVTGVGFQRYGIDPLGRLALSVGLADGRRLIVRAEQVLDSGGACDLPEPEPGEGAAAAVAGMVGVAAAARRRSLGPSRRR